MLRLSLVVLIGSVLIREAEASLLAILGGGFLTSHLGSALAAAGIEVAEIVAIILLVILVLGLIACLTGSVLTAAGFGVTGIVAGSLAAETQAAIGNVVGGSIFATLQAAGASGAIAALTTVGGLAALMAGVAMLIFV